MNDTISHYKMQFNHCDKDYEYHLAVIPNWDGLIFEVTGEGFDKCIFKLLPNDLFRQFEFSCESAPYDPYAVMVPHPYCSSKQMEPEIRRIVKDGLREKFYKGEHSLISKD